MEDKANGNAVTTVSSTLHYRRQHPGGGSLGRCSYGVPGVAGIVVFDMGMFAPGVLVNGLPPATITVNVEFAAPQARKVAAVTSAVIAAGNATTAVAAGSAIAAPAVVAAAAPATVAALPQAAAPARKGSRK